jgi:hypothetical protein
MHLRDATPEDRAEAERLCSLANNEYPAEDSDPSNLRPAEPLQVCVMDGADVASGQIDELQIGEVYYSVVDGLVHGGPGWDQFHGWIRAEVEKHWLLSDKEFGTVTADSRMECYACRGFDGVHFVLRMPTGKTKTVNPADLTVAYELECGHWAI